MLFFEKTCENYPVVRIEKGKIIDGATKNVASSYFELIWNWKNFNNNFCCFWTNEQNLFQ